MKIAFDSNILLDAIANRAHGREAQKHIIPNNAAEKSAALFGMMSVVI